VRDKEVLAKQFEQRIAGLRLEKEQAKLDKGLLRRMEKELAELKSLSTSALGPLVSQVERPSLPRDSVGFDLPPPNDVALAYLSRREPLPA
jgi:hypothetical protein